MHFVHEALECLSRDPKARLALVEAGAAQMLVRRCTASAAAARAAEEAVAARAAEADAEPDTNTAMAMARSPSSRHQQTATDEAMSDVLPRRLRALLVIRKYGPPSLTRMVAVQLLCGQLYSYAHLSMIHVF